MAIDPQTRRQDLLIAAREARENAHSPYSKYKVGAAVLLPDGTIVKGANVENASYGLTCCAERTAIFTAVTTHGAKRFLALAVSVLPDPARAPTTPPTARDLSPCGACRQVMAEFMDDDAPVFVDGPRDYTLGDLLPDAFRIK